MEKLNGMIQKMSLKKALLSISAVSIILIAALSVVTIFLLLNLNQKILNTRPITIRNSDIQYEAGEKEEGDSLQYIVKPDQYVYGKLTAENQLKYNVITFLMAALPVLYVAIGSLAVAVFYYQVKLRVPIETLKRGISHIADQNLDFELHYHAEDELGMLCSTFESMRKELYKNNQRMWEAMQDRKALTASVSHDLRTPITVIKGYLDYLSKTMLREQLTEEVLEMTLHNMMQSTERLERYVSCIHDIEKIEEIEIEKSSVCMKELMSCLEKDFSLMAEQRNITFVLDNKAKQEVIYTDKNMLFKVLENLFNNALRFTRDRILLTITEHEDAIAFVMEDNGNGFSQDELEHAASLFYTSNGNADHFGLGLSICKILCGKLGGSLHLKNSPDGASVIIKIKK
ncbi:MAG: ATP-binding protein [Blautia sp.]|jgi:signal transduction histidine kinase